jgi:hypothetical protein
VDRPVQRRERRLTGGGACDDAQQRRGPGEPLGDVTGERVEQRARVGLGGDPPRAGLLGDLAVVGAARRALYQRREQRRLRPERGVDRLGRGRGVRGDRRPRVAVRDEARAGGLQDAPARLERGLAPRRSSAA